MNMYDAFSRYYDDLTGDVDYKKRTKYLLSLFKKYDKKPSLLLDLACGTGGFSVELAKAGIEVVGVDISEGMLDCAKKNCEKAGQDILFLCQDATELELYGTVDGAVCCLDSLNHITDYKDFCRAISRVALFLEKDRLFIFDLNTEYKQREILGDNIFVMDEPPLYCVWSNFYDAPSHTTDVVLDFFEQTDNGTYNRTCEEFSERVYSKEEILTALKNAGLELVASFEEMTENEPNATTQRIVYVTRRI